MTVSTTGVDGGAAEVRFLENLQLVLAESQTSSTYKYALLIALADLCIEDARPDGEAELTIPIARIAEKFLELYWGHAAPTAPDCRAPPLEPCCKTAANRQPSSLRRTACAKRWGLPRVRATTGAGSAR